MGMVATGTSLGGLFMPPLIAFLQAEFGWRQGNIWLSGIAMTLILFTALVIRNAPGISGRRGCFSTKNF